MKTHFRFCTHFQYRHVTDFYSDKALSYLETNVKKLEKLRGKDECALN